MPLVAMEVRFAFWWGLVGSRSKVKLRAIGFAAGHGACRQGSRHRVNLEWSCHMELIRPAVWASCAACSVGYEVSPAEETSSRSALWADFYGLLC